MIASDKARQSSVAFLLLAAAIYIGNFAISSLWQTHAQLPVPEWTAGFDLLVFLPVAYLLIKRPSVGKALLGVFAIASLGILAGSWIIPQQDKHWWLVLENLRWFYLGALVLGQLALVASVLRDIRRNWKVPNIETAVNKAIAGRVPEATVVRLLQADARVWLYAFVRNPAKFVFDAPAFTCWRHDSNASNQQAFLILIVAEIPLMHVIVHLFSPTIALWLTAFSVYGLLFLYSEYRATLLRATTLDADGVHIRHGVLGDLKLPYACIASIESVSNRPRRQKSLLRFVGTGTANIKLNLKPATRLRTLLGLKPIASVYLGLDEPHQFAVALAERLPKSKNE